MNCRSVRFFRSAQTLSLTAMLLLVACSASPPPATTDQPGNPAKDPSVDATAVPPPTAAIASPAPVVVPLSPAERLMQMVDRDGDGRMSRAEHAEKTMSTFNDMDSDHDGKVTVDEMDVVRQGYYGDNRTATAAALSIGDSDHDGVLSAEEHAIATRVEFERMDADHDAYLTMAELQATQASSKDERPTVRR